MENCSKKAKKQSKFNYSIESILPLLLIILIVPLIVRLKIVNLQESSSLLLNGQTTSGDFFTYYKMVYFLMFTTIGTLVFAYKYFYKKDIVLKKTSIYYPMIVYTVLIVLSTIFATYNDVAVKGIFDRHEGMLTLIGYMLCLFLTINLIDNERQVKYMLLALGISSLIISLIGIFQFFGKDIFTTAIGKKLIIPIQYRNLSDEINFIFSEAKTIYGTLINPNYVGVYMSILFPLSCTIFLLCKEIEIKIFSGTIALLSLLNLFGSGSRTGIMNLFMYFFLLIIFFRRIIFKKWKIGIAIIIILTIAVVGINFFGNGMLIKRIISIKNSITNNKASNLKDIRLENNEAIITIEDYAIKVIYEDENFTFKDKNDDSIKIKVKNNRISFEEEPYSNHVFDMAKYDDNLVLIPIIKTNLGWQSLNLAVDSDENFKFLNNRGELLELKKVPSWGFKNTERFASSRGYIWSRSIPMLINTIFLGYGPDTYALHFPQDDYIGKLQGMGNMDVIVDKPHNLYLQIAINTGVISLISLFILFIMYIKSSIKTYVSKKDYNNIFEIAGLSIFLSICSYLMVGILNDSVVAVAPIFWILLGLGISINMKLNERFDNN